MDTAFPSRETFVTLTADIVAAHVGSNQLAAAEIPILIEKVFTALSGLGRAQRTAPREPAVSLRASVKPEHVTCLECGRTMKMLKRHLSTDHALTPAEYRARWGLGADHPLVAPNYANRRRELAKKIGLGRKPGQKRGRRKKGS